MARKLRLWAVGVVSVFLFLVVGCATQARYYSSVVDYLYPGKTDPVVQPAIPVMSIPMKVAIAFVPDIESQRQQTFWQEFSQGRARKPTGMVLTEKQKLDLMQEVSNYFRKYPYIGSIEIIPSAYLTPAGSFANLDQIRTMYGVDAVALLAYDQVQFTDEGAASFLYWTIVGAYVVPGEKNTTQTMMDAVIYDIKSRKMLFRAPGVSQVKSTATPVNLSEELRNNSEQGFQEAAKDLIKNLDTQLAFFKDKIKQTPEEYKVVHRPGYTGGGSLGMVFLVLFMLIGGYAWLRLRRN
jgi:rhombotail lipoprotein